MDYKEAFFKLLGKKLESLPLQKEEEAKETIKETFELLESLDPERQEFAKDWLAQTAIYFVEEDEPFVAEAIRFIRPEAFKGIKKSETPTEKSSHGGLSDEG